MRLPLLWLKYQKGRPSPLKCIISPTRWVSISPDPYIKRSSMFYYFLNLCYKLRILSNVNLILKMIIWITRFNLKGVFLIINPDPWIQSLLRTVVNKNICLRPLTLLAHSFTRLVSLHIVYVNVQNSCCEQFRSWMKGRSALRSLFIVGLTKPRPLRSRCRCWANRRHV